MRIILLTFLSQSINLATAGRNYASSGSVMSWYNDEIKLKHAGGTYGASIIFISHVYIKID